MSIALRPSTTHALTVPGRLTAARRAIVEHDLVREGATPRTSTRHLGQVLVLLLLAAGVFGGGLLLPRSSLTEDARLFADGAARQQAGELVAAQTDYLAVLHADPLNPYAYYDLGVLYEESGQALSAVADYERALLIDFDYRPAIFNLAVVESALSPPLAIGLYRRLVALEPADGVAHLNLGLLELHLQMTAAGNADLLRAMALEPALGDRIPPSLVPRA